MSKNLIKSIDEEISKIYPEIIKIRNHIHENPELSEQEYNTSEYICNILTANDIEFTRMKKNNGICAIIRGQSNKPCVGIRADMDALPINEDVEWAHKSKVPNIMHACGHDIHTSILLGTAIVLKSHSDHLKGSVKFFFQPAEETVGGANSMISEGVLESPKVDYAIALHIDPSLDVGTVNLCPGPLNGASTEFEVKVCGKSSHGAHPNMGIDPIITSCHIITLLQSGLTRIIDPIQPSLITVGQIHGGSKGNIIPDSVTFSGIIRSLNESNIPKIQEVVQNICESTANGFGATVEITFKDGYPALTNSEKLFPIIKSSCELTLGESNVLLNQVPSLGCDDFAYFAKSVESFYYDLGCKKPDCKTSYPLHSSKLDPDPECIKFGIQTQVYSILKIMEVL